MIGLQIDRMNRFVSPSVFLKMTRLDLVVIASGAEDGRRARFVKRLPVVRSPS